MKSFCKECVEYNPGSKECDQPVLIDRIVAVFAMARNHAMSLGLGHQIPIGVGSPRQGGGLLAEQDAEIDACIARHQPAQPTEA